MRNKRILIVDDEEPILTILKHSLKKLGPGYEVLTVSDGFAALDELKVREFDLVVTDYNMAQMDGLELLEAVRYMQPTARVIMITAFGSDELEAETRRLQIYHYLTKPLEINLFRQVVQEALSELAVTPPPGPENLAAAQHQQVGQILDQLRRDVNARCIFMANAQGHIIASSGDTGKVPLKEIASLLGAGLSTLNEAGQTLDQDWETINLVYREGKHEHLYALNVDQNLLLILVIGRGPYSSRLGAVWYYARQVTLNLRQIGPT